MATVQLSRKNTLAILAGFAVIVLIGIITSILSFFMSSHLVRTLAVEDFKSAFTQQPYVTFRWILSALSFVSPIIGGFIVGWLVKEKGWLYGGILGVTLKLISIGIVSLTFILPASLIYGSHLPPQQGQGLAQQNILNQLLYLPIAIILTTLGGYLGEHLHKRNRKRK